MNRSRFTPSFRPLPRLGLVAAGLLLGTLPLAAQQSSYRQQGNHLVREVQGSITTATPLEITVESQLGNVSVQQAAGNALRYDVLMETKNSPQARAQLDQWPVTVQRNGNVLLVRAAQGPSGRGDNRLRMTVEVPANATVVRVHSAAGNIEAGNLTVPEHLETAGGNVSVAHPRAATWVATAGGNISVGGVTGDLHAATAGGNVSIGDVAGDTHVETQGGNVSIGNVHGLHVSSGGGSIHVQSARNDVYAMTGGGSINLGNIGGAVHAQTGGGNVEVARARSLVSQTGGGNIVASAVDGAVRAETGAGSIDVGIVATSGFGASHLRSGVGKITVRLPQQLPVSVSADLNAPMGHAIISDFPALNAKPNGPTPLHVQAPLNGGGPRLQIQTNGGDIVIRKQTPAAMRSAVDWKMGTAREIAK